MNLFKDHMTFMFIFLKTIFIIFCYVFQNDYFILIDVYLFKKRLYIVLFNVIYLNILWDF